MNLNADNYFELFGISEDATEREIKLAYVKLLRQYPNETHPEEFQLISKAYEILTSPEKKEKYLREMKDDGLYDRLLNEAYEHFNNEKFPLAKLALIELMKNGYDNEPDILILYKNVCREMEDFEEERKIIRRLESDFSHIIDVKYTLCYYYGRIEDYSRAVQYAKQLIEIEPHNNEVFLTLIHYEFKLKNYVEVSRLFTNKLNEIPTIIQNFSVYDDALFFAMNNENDQLVKLTLVKYKELAETNKKYELLNKMIDSSTSLYPNYYTFKFYILLIEELNNGEFKDVEDWTNRAKELFDENLEYYSLNKKAKPTFTESKQAQPLNTKTKSINYHDSKNIHNTPVSNSKRVTNKGRSKYPILVSIGAIVAACLFILPLLIPDNDSGNYGERNSYYSDGYIEDYSTNDSYLEETDGTSYLKYNEISNNYDRALAEVYIEKDTNIFDEIEGYMMDELLMADSTWLVYTIVGNWYEIQDNIWIYLPNLNPESLKLKPYSQVAMNKQSLGTIYVNRNDIQVYETPVATDVYKRYLKENEYYEVFALSENKWMQLGEDAWVLYDLALEFYQSELDARRYSDLVPYKEGRTASDFIPVFREPNRQSEVFGYVIDETSLPIYDSMNADWIDIGYGAWIEADKYMDIDWVYRDFDSLSHYLPIGELEVITEVLNVRLEPNMESSLVGTVHKGQFIQVYDIDNLTGWYLIGENAWVSNKAELVAFTDYIEQEANEILSNGNMEPIGYLIVNAYYLPIYDYPDFYREPISYTTRSPKKINIYEVSDNGEWFRVGESEWVPSSSQYSEHILF